MSNKNIIYAVIIALVVFITISFHINDSLIFHSDFARDLYEILKISQGNLTLLGPKLSFGGLYSAPYYYYLFVPVFLLSGFKIISLFYFNVFLFVLAISYFFINVKKKFSLWQAVISSLIITLVPVFLFAARNPSVSNTHIAFLLMLLTYIYFNKIEKPLTVLILGLIFGVMINFGFLNLLLLIPIYILILSKLNKKIYSLYFFPGIAISFLPLLVFEIKHNFVMLKNTFLEKSYLSWIENKNIIHGTSGKKNLIANFFFMANKIQALILINPIISLFFLSIIQFFEKKTRRNFFLIFIGLLSLLIISLLIKYQLAPHYLYPTSFFIFFVFVILLLESRFKILIVLLFVAEILFFPKEIYKKSTIVPEPFEAAVKYSIEKHLVEKNSRFNVVMIADPNAVIGFEYRYFFQKYGFTPLSEFEYSKSDILLIFTKINSLDPSTLNTWEIEQFGKKYLSKTSKYKVGDILIFKAEKNNRLKKA